MGILNKIFTAFRGGAREVGESVVDANAVRIYEQEIYDSETHLKKAKHSLTEVMAKQMQAARKVDSLQKEVTEHEGYARQALDKGDENLALEIANKISELETQLNEQQEVKATYDNHVVRLKEQIRTAERQIAENKRQLSMVKTTESVQKATAAVSDSFGASGSRLLNAKESLERIRQKQQDREDKLTAAKTLESEGGDGDLMSRLQEAGIKSGKGSSGQAVLDRLKGGSSSGSDSNA